MWFMAVIAGLGLLIAGVSVTLIAIGKLRGVQATAVADNSLMAPQTTGANYVDAYQIQVPDNRFADLEALIAVAFQKGQLVAKNDHEVLYTDVAPGLRFHVSYTLKREAGAATVTMATSVHYTKPKGRIYFAFVRPFHRAFLPFAISQMVK